MLPSVSMIYLLILAVHLLATDHSGVVLLDLEAIDVRRVADYHAGRFPSAEPHIGPERQELRSRHGIVVARRQGTLTHTVHRSEG